MHQQESARSSADTIQTTLHQYWKTITAPATKYEATTGNQNLKYSQGREADACAYEANLRTNEEFLRLRNDQQHKVSQSNRVPNQIRHLKVGGQAMTTAALETQGIAGITTRESEVPPNNISPTPRNAINVSLTPSGKHFIDCAGVQSKTSANKQASKFSTLQHHQPTTARQDYNTKPTSDIQQSSHTLESIKMNHIPCPKSKQVSPRDQPSKKTHSIHSKDDKKLDTRTKNSNETIPQKPFDSSTEGLMLLQPGEEKEPSETPTKIKHRSLPENCHGTPTTREYIDTVLSSVPRDWSACVQSGHIRSPQGSSARRASVSDKRGFLSSRSISTPKGNRDRAEGRCHPQENRNQLIPGNKLRDIVRMTGDTTYCPNPTTSNATHTTSTSPTSNHVSQKKSTMTSASPRGTTHRSIRCRTLPLEIVRAKSKVISEAIQRRNHLLFDRATMKIGRTTESSQNHNDSAKHPNSPRRKHVPVDRTHTKDASNTRNPIRHHASATTSNSALTTEQRSETSKKHNPESIRADSRLISEEVKCRNPLATYQDYSKTVGTPTNPQRRNANESDTISNSSSLKEQRLKLCNKRKPDIVQIGTKLESEATKRQQRLSIDQRRNHDQLVQIGNYQSEKAIRKYDKNKQLGKFRKRHQENEPPVLQNTYVREELCTGKQIYQPSVSRKIPNGLESSDERNIETGGIERSEISTQESYVVHMRKEYQIHSRREGRNKNRSTTNVRTSGRGQILNECTPRGNRIRINGKSNCQGIRTQGLSSSNKGNMREDHKTGLHTEENKRNRRSTYVHDQTRNKSDGRKMETEKKDTSTYIQETDTKQEHSNCNEGRRPGILETGIMKYFNRLWEKKKKPAKTEIPEHNVSRK